MKKVKKTETYWVLDDMNGCHIFKKEPAERGCLSFGSFKDAKKYVVDYWQLRVDDAKTQYKDARSLRKKDIQD